jgi:alkanesulfonate monooxygenase SsuD/methylene tetrahydromethanopterin reductase-like flavin-dependent oxidoreductase (luciferase family)
MMEYHLFLPQMRLSPEAVIERAQAAEAAGFTGIALMDHLSPPLAEDQPMYEAWVTATWVAAHTRSLTIGHLVLCDSFRSPAVLARQAVTLDHCSGGRVELGIGSGSTPEELGAFGIDEGTAGGRIRRLGETLEVVSHLWTGEPVHFDGDYHRINGGRQLPVPTRPIPVVVGGTGPSTMELVAKYADWWNIPGHQSDRLESMRPSAGSARVSMQQVVTMVPDEASRQEVTGLARRRFGWMRSRLEGTGAELVDHFAALEARGVERIYTWFTDFAAPETLARFGTEVIGGAGQ